MTNTLSLTFQPLAEAHFPFLLKWLEVPHVKAWWDQEVTWTSELIREKYSSYVKGYKRLKIQDRIIKKPMHGFIIVFEEAPIGYIQYYNKHDFPPEQGYETGELPSSCAAIDWYIGELEFIGKGIGPMALERFLELHVFPYFDWVFVDPDTANTSAVRAYEKAGFKEIKKVTNGEITWMLKSKNVMKQTFYQLEALLLDSSVRKSLEKLNQLIADDFIEFGSSGKIYTKQDVFAALLSESPRQFIVKDFDVKELSENIVLATYKTEEKGKKCLRSSIWKKADEDFRMIFHQGTKCGDEI